ncbi:hypothetical protein E2562_038943, partial [Oryza meyeriana var. granulata]
MKSFRLDEIVARRERESLLRAAISGSQGVRKLVGRNEAMTEILVEMAPHLAEVEQLRALKAEMEVRHAGREAWAQARKIRALEAELKTRTERESQLKEAEEARAELEKVKADLTKANA